MKIQPITRKERFLNEIVGWGETAPKNELTTEELFFAKILGRNVTLPDLSNVPRYYLFLAKIADENVNISPPTHVSPPLEFFLAKAAGMDVVTPVPLTKEEIFWANYKGIEQIIEGVPPLTFKSNGASLSNYRIYGNTVNGESVGNLVESGEHTGEYLVPVTINGNTTSIYLLHQIRKVGNESEYVDYGEQKQHRVRKNLLNYSSIEIGRFDFSTGEKVPDSSQFRTSTPIKVKPNESYAISGVASGQVRVFLYDGNMNMISTVLRSDNSVVETTGSTVFVNVAGIKSAWSEQIQLEIGSEATGYEPYIENTELNVTLPTLPTLSGTNTLSFETTVQPSKVMIKTGKFGTHKVRYYDSDGTFLSAEDVKDGANAQGFTPTKASTAQYNYTFMGWSTTKGSTIAETGILNDITADKSLYAVFSQSLRTFTVYFYNGSTLLQTAENVQYGGTATYTGETPTKDGFTFSGWQPSNVNITADTSCYAQFVEG